MTGPLQDSRETAITTVAGTSFVTMANSAGLNVGDVLTVECWAKLASSAANQTFVHKGANAYGVSFQAHKLVLNQVGVNTIVSSTVNVDDNAWHHLVVTKSGATVKLYVDGVDRTGAVTNLTLVDNTAAFNVGIRSPSTDGEGLAGSIDEVALYGTALTAARVVAHYAAGLGELPATAVFPKLRARAPALRRHRAGVAALVPAPPAAAPVFAPRPTGPPRLRWLPRRIRSRSAVVLPVQAPAPLLAPRPVVAATRGRLPARPRASAAALTVVGGPAAPAAGGWGIPL